MKAKFPPARILNLTMISGDAVVRRYRTKERGSGGAMSAFVLLNILNTSDLRPPTCRFNEETQWLRSVKSVSKRANGNALAFASGDQPAFTG